MRREHTSGQAPSYARSVAFVDSDLTGRGRGAGDLGRERATEPWEDDSAMLRAFLPLADDEDEYGMLGSVETDSPYFDKSKEYLQILSADTSELTPEEATAEVVRLAGLTPVARAVGTPRSVGDYPLYDQPV